MVLTSSGEILTNNHVIAGATTIKVVVPGTKHTYTAQVVGYERTDDVAVLQLQNASNLKTVTTANSSALAVGRDGDRGRQRRRHRHAHRRERHGDRARASRSRVQDDSGGAEQLSGLIETNAGAAARRLRRPAAEQRRARRRHGHRRARRRRLLRRVRRASDGYAIPINKALDDREADRGRQAPRPRSHIGATAFLGVQASTSPYRPGGDVAGAVIAGVVSGGPADTAGPRHGRRHHRGRRKGRDQPADLRAIVLDPKPGDKVAIAYTDTYGQSRP